MKALEIIAQTPGVWLTMVMVLIALPYILSIASLVFAVKKKWNWSGGLLVPAALFSYYLLTGDVTAVSLAPAVICGITVIVLMTAKPSSGPKKPNQSATANDLDPT